MTLNLLSRLAAQTPRGAGGVADRFWLTDPSAVTTPEFGYFVPGMDASLVRPLEPGRRAGHQPPN